jgi:hypothetical protein
LLYAFRVLLTGIHLMKTGRVEANLLVLNAEIARFEGEYQRLTSALELAAVNSALPERPTAFDSLNALLLRLRCPPVAQ